MPNQDPTRLARNVAVSRFLAAWKVESYPDIGKFLPRDEDGRQECLRELILADIEQQFALDDCVDLTSYFSQFPELHQFEWTLEFLDAEIKERSQRGLPAEVHRYEESLPGLVANYLAFRHQTNPTSEIESKNDSLSASLESGTRLAGFEVISLIGSGTHGRVYLARDETLDRQVALKVSTVRGDEGRALAKLNHPGIVRVYREQIVGDHKLLAMQLVVGRTLADWIKERALLEQKQWRFADLLKWIRRTKHPHNVEPEQEQDPAELPEDLSLVPTAVHLVLAIARAIHHAHQHGVLHRDVKPTNILLDGSGRPLLTDFNVAALREGTRNEQFGGTLAYMSPEHLKALEAWLPGCEDDVDVRSDIYSLGIVLCELLTGHKYWGTFTEGENHRVVSQLLAQRLSSSPDSLTKLEGVTPALAAIVSKCVAPQPRDRYQNAEDLAQDLERWLNDRPPKFAADPSWRERTSRWTRRNRIRFLSIAVVAIVGLVVLGASVQVGHNTLRRCETLIQEAETEAVSGNSAGVAAKVGEAKGLLTQSYAPRWFTRQRWRQLEEKVDQLGAVIADIELERFTVKFDEVRLVSPTWNEEPGSRDLAADALRTYGVLHDHQWESRSPFVDLAHRDRDAVTEHITELILVSLLQSHAEDLSDLAQVNQVLTRLPRRHQQFGIFTSVGRGEEIAPDAALDSLDSVTSFEAYLYGVVASLRENDDVAHQWFEHSLRQRKNGERLRFWAYYWDGYVCQRMGRNEEAIARYGVCIGIRPDFAWPYFNMGLACLATNRVALAESFLRETVERDTRFAPAHVALAALYFRDKQYNKARQECDQAIALGHKTAETYKNRAAANAAMGETVRAIADLESALRENPDDQSARRDLQRLLDDQS